MIDSHIIRTSKEKWPALTSALAKCTHTLTPAHAHLGSFSPSCLGGALCFCGFALGALSLGALSLGAGCGVFCVLGSLAGRAVSSRVGLEARELGGGVVGRLAGLVSLGVAGRFPAGAAARASLGDMAGARYGAPAALAATTPCPLNSPGRAVAATAGAP